MINSVLAKVFGDFSATGRALDPIFLVRLLLNDTSNIRFDHYGRVYSVITRQSIGTLESALYGEAGDLHFAEKRGAAPIWNLDDFFGPAAQEICCGSPDSPIVFSVVEVVQEEVAPGMQTWIEKLQCGHGRLEGIGIVHDQAESLVFETSGRGGKEPYAKLYIGRMTEKLPDRLHARILKAPIAIRETLERVEQIQLSLRRGAVQEFAGRSAPYADLCHSTGDGIRFKAFDS